MKIEQIYTNCLAHGAYYIESDGEAAIIDPLREVQPYIDLANKRNARIKYIFETHFHADFVSGHVDLSKKTSAPIIYGPSSLKTGFDAIIASDGDEFTIGSLKIKVLHTPGHTMESSCFLLFDENGIENAIFTGDTLFIGDVGRPDLAQHVNSDLSQEKLASYLYDSLHNKILPLPDHIIVYPAHGAGSACGKNISKETSDTLGHQKKTNYALREDLTKEQFIKELLTGLTTPPYYFPKNVMMNVQGYDSMDKVIERGSKAFTVREFEMLMNQPHTLVLDTRKAVQFAKSFIPDSINIGIDGNFAIWVGTLITDINQKILLIADPGREHEVISRLARVGYDNTIGYLEGGYESWLKSGRRTDNIPTVSVDQFAETEASHPDIRILDVRKKSEYDSEHIINATNLPLDYINTNMEQIDKDKIYYVHCAGGYRSMIFSSILKARGYHNLIDVDGGFQAIKNSGKFKITEYVCPKTML